MDTLTQSAVPEQSEPKIPQCDIAHIDEPSDTMPHEENSDNTENGSQNVIQTVDGLWNQRDIAQAIGVEYERLRGYLRDPVLQVALGGVRVRGQKGYRFPESAVATMRTVMEAADARRVTPSTVLHFVRAQGLVQSVSTPSINTPSEQSVGFPDGVSAEDLMAVLTRQAEAAERLVEAQAETNRLLARQIALLETATAIESTEGAPVTNGEAPPSKPGLWQRLLGRG